jgi:ATP-dependent RNA helicase SUPV3L1/SUV3
LRVDLAEKLIHATHAARLAAPGRRFVIGPDLALSMGLNTASFAALLRLAGFRALVPRALAEDTSGPPAPLLWEWRPPRRERGPERRDRARAAPRPENAFAALADWRAG